MQFGLPGTINSSVDSHGISVMTSGSKKPGDKAADAVWDDIFNSLIIDTEPPTRYIKNVIIQTRDGSVIKVSGKSFAEIIEQERHLTPGRSEILSCRLSINFSKVRADVDLWSGELFAQLNADDRFKTMVRPRSPQSSNTAGLS